MGQKRDKMYTLYANLSYQDIFKYTPEQMAKSQEKEGKRSLALMYAENIEDLDQLTDQYASIDDLLSTYMEEVYGVKKMLYNPMIIVDKDPIDRKDSYVIFDIAFRGEFDAIKNVAKVRKEVEKYLEKFPKDVSKFRGMNDIYINVKNANPGIGDAAAIARTIDHYFLGENYKRSREAYFKLKELDPERVKRNDIHR